MVSDQPQPQRFLPLRGLANVITVLLAVVVASIAVRLVIQTRGLGSPQWQRSLDGHLDKFANIVIFAEAVLFVVWFRRARINAERHGYRQRRGLAWTLWGWIIPILNIWIPFQIMGDIWRAGLPPQEREKVAWPPALWWTCWLLSGLSVSASAAAAAGGGFLPHLSAGTQLFSMCFLAAAGAVLIPIVRTVSAGAVGSPLS